MAKYNPDKEYFPIKLIESREIKNIHVPLNLAQEFKKNRNRLEVYGYKQINLNLEWEYVDVVIKNPINGKSYPYIETTGQYFVYTTPSKVSGIPNIIVDVLFSEPSENIILDAEESGEIKVSLKNEGKVSAYDLKLSMIYLSGPHLRWDRNKEISELKSGADETIVFNVFADKNVSTGKTYFEIIFIEKNGFEPDPIPLVIETQKLLTPILELTGVMFNDESENSKIERSEEVKITARITNVGNGPAQNIKVKINLGRNVFIKDDSQSNLLLGDLSPGDYIDIEFTIFTNKRIKKEIPISIYVTESRTNFYKDMPLNLTINEKIKQSDILSFSVDIERDIPFIAKKRESAFAVVIGNRDYQKELVPIVDYGIRDAKYMKEYLVKTLGYKNENIFYYTNATFGDIRTALGRLQNSVVKGKSDVFIYYSGHGAPDVESKTGYLVPVDCNPNYVKTGGYSLTDLYDVINNMEAKSVTVVLDACFSGVSPEGPLLTNRSPIYIDIKPNQVTLKDYTIFSSSSERQVSTWYRKKKHSLFTYYFLKAMQGAADENGDKILSVAEMEKYLKENVSSKAMSLNNALQIPQIHTNDVNKTFLRWD